MELLPSVMKRCRRAFQRDHRPGLQMFAHNESSMSCTGGIKNIVHDDDAILDFKYKSDVSLFFANLAYSVLYSAANILIGNGAVIILSVILSVFAVLIHKSFWSPISYTKELTQVGFEHISSGPDRERRIARAQASRRMGTKIPPPYPNGWFAVAESRHLKKGGVLSADALGQNLCIYRGEDGGARCVDAYCPHLGANLAIGGSVCGNCIECPFHKWTFDDKGACVSVPGQENAPKGVSIRTWHTVEADGAVWIWHDAEHREPLWELSDAPECKTWGYRGRNEFIVSAHIQEIPENGADVAHLNAVHATSLLSALGDRYPILDHFIGRHVWSATWERNDDHTATMILKHDYRILKHEFFHLELNVTQTGPGHVRLRMSTPIGPFLFSQSVTPIGPMLQRVVHRLYSPAYNAPLNAVMIYGEGLMIERDIKIWNSKRFVSAPTYVKADKTVRAFRNWYSQFYSENSMSFRDALNNPLEW